MPEVHTTDSAVAPLPRDQFNALTMRIVDATCDGTTVNDAVCGMVSALGSFLSAAGQEDGVSKDELLKFCLESLATYAASATRRDENQGPAMAAGTLVSKGRYIHPLSPTRH
jgi:hypothetical protein